MRGLVAGRAKQRQHADDAQDEQGQHAERDRHGQEVERLAVQVEAWRREVAAILELADELKDNTIEALLRKRPGGGPGGAARPGAPPPSSAAADLSCIRMGRAVAARRWPCDHVVTL